MAALSPCLLLCLLAFARATTIDINGVEENEEEGEGRTIFTSGGTYYIALNTTFLLYYSLIAGALLLAGLALSGVFSGSAESTGYGQRLGQGVHQRVGAEEAYSSRAKRQAYSTGELANTTFNLNLQQQNCPKFGHLLSPLIPPPAKCPSLHRMIYYCEIRREIMDFLKRKMRRQPPKAR